MKMVCAAPLRVTLVQIVTTLAHCDSSGSAPFSPAVFHSKHLKAAVSFFYLTAWLLGTVCHARRSRSHLCCRCLVHCHGHLPSLATMPMLSRPRHNACCVDPWCPQTSGITERMARDGCWTKQGLCSAPACLRSSTPWNGCDLHSYRSLMNVLPLFYHLRARLAAALGGAIAAPAHWRTSAGPPSNCALIALHQPCTLRRTEPFSPHFSTRSPISGRP